MRTVALLATGALLSVAVAGVAGLIFLKTGSGGFSARADPSPMEVFAARTARKLALPAGVKDKANPVSDSKETIAEAMAHWADHCAICHANDGSGRVEMGQQMYPHAPDMRGDSTQKLTDGELFYIIGNGIRLTGMPAWGGTETGAKDSWKLVRFIRHLPGLSAQEITAMERLNPKGPEDREQERQEEDFLNGRERK